MTSRLGKKEKIILFAGILFILAFGVFGYFLFIQPLRTQIETKENELSTQKQLFEVLDNREIQSSGELIENSVQLQKHVPVEPMLEQFILDLDMAETVSNSQILSMSFSDEGAAGGAATPTEDNQQPTDGTQPAVIQKPAGIKSIAISLSMESASYYDLEKFIDTLEKLDRIVEVKSVSFAGPAEITSVGTGTDQSKMSYSLSIAIFYYPELQDLAKELPKMEIEPPANKSNPLSDFSDIKGEFEENQP